jgi:CRP/FNR family transcriptional regulator, dissimilatory nitrate respiration regulator
MQPTELDRMAGGCTVGRIDRGGRLFSVGEPCNEFHVVLAGQMKLFALSASGQEKVIELISPGQSFGEALMFTNRPYIINAEALADSLILTVQKDAVLREIESDPRFALRMLAGISRRLHGLVHDVESYSLQSGVQRVIGYLLGDSEAESADAEQGVRVVRLPVSKATIASRLSLTPEYFSRVLHELTEQQLIEVDKRDIRIRDVQRLASYPVQ